MSLILKLTMTWKHPKFTLTMHWMHRAPKKAPSFPVSPMVATLTHVLPYLRMQCPSCNTFALLSPHLPRMIKFSNSRMHLHIAMNGLY